jgi:tetratricopeptide (TPR) repeat protein
MSLTAPINFMKYKTQSLGINCLAIAVALMTAVWDLSIAQASIEIPLRELGEVSLDEKQLRLEELLKQSGGDPYVLEELGRIAHQRANPTLAAELWNRAAKQEPNIASAEVQLVFADIASGQLESAQKRLDRLKVASTTDPHVLIAAGELALLRRDAKTANQLLQRALDMAPHFAATHLTLGYFMEVSGQVDTARTFYQKVTELEPDRSPGWLRLAALHFRQNRATEALAAYRQAEKCRGNQPLAETRLGEAYYLRGDLVSSHLLFTAALKRNENDPFPRLRVAQILERTGQTEAFRKQLDQILHSQEYPEALKIAAENELKAGNLEQALDYYRRRLKALPDDWITANNLALLLVQTKGSPQEALELSAKAANLARQPIPALQGTHGCALWYAGRIDDAEPLLQQAIAALPNNSWTRYCFAQVLLAQRRPAEAQQQFKACQFLDPAFQRRDEVGQILAKLQSEGHTQWQPEWEREPVTSTPPASQASATKSTEPEPGRSLLRPAALQSTGP